MAVIISGNNGATLTKGTVVTLSGSGFGAHANYNGAPRQYTWNGNLYLCRTFKDSEDGNLFSHGWFRNTDESAGTVTLIGSGGHSGAYYRATSGAGRLVAYGISNTHTASESVMYTSFWFRATGTLAAADGKYHRNYYGGAGDSQQYFISTGGMNWNGRGGTDGSDDDYGSLSSPYGTSTWKRVDSLLVKGPSGAVIVTINGQQNSNRTWSKGSWETGHTCEWPDMIESSGGEYNYDDVFYDYTQARVEISDGATWANRWASGAHCEVQIPTAWATGSASLAFNPGSFANGASVYFYLIDSAGLVNATGYGPYTVGSSMSGGSPPIGTPILSVR